MNDLIPNQVDHIAKKGWIAHWKCVKATNGFKVGDPTTSNFGGFKSFTDAMQRVKQIEALGKFKLIELIRIE